MDYYVDTQENIVSTKGVITIEWRDQLVRLDAVFGTELIPLKKATAYLGLNELSVKNDKYFPIKRIGGRYYVPKIELAKYMCK